MSECGFCFWVSGCKMLCHEGLFGGSGVISIEFRVDVEA